MIGWTPRERPARTVIEGAHCCIEPLDAERHGAGLFEAYGKATDGSDWTYLFTEPFADFDVFREYLNKAQASVDPLHYTVIDTARNKAVGTFALMRIEPVHGVIEVGSVTFSPLLKRTRISTEAPVFANESCLRSARLSSLRMEMRQPQGTVAQDRPMSRISVQGYLPADDRL